MTTLPTHTGAASRLIAAMPTRTIDEVREQDLAACDAVETLVAGCEGNGDAYVLFMDTVETLRAQIRKAREQDAIAARREDWVRRRVISGAMV